MRLTSPSLNQNKGRVCEKIAKQHFQNKNYQLIATNTKLYKVEIDLLLKKNQTYYIVEVKSNNQWRMQKPLSKAQLKRLQTISIAFSEEHQSSTRLLIAIVSIKTKKVEVYSLDDWLSFEDKS